MAEYRWEKTKDYEDLINRWLTDEGFVDLYIERISRNRMILYLQHKGLNVLQMGPFHLQKTGDVIRVQGLKVRIESDAIKYE